MESENFIESLIGAINEFDFAALMPDLTSILGWITFFVRLCTLAAPIALVFFGLWWLLLPPKEANHSVGYRCYFGMGSIDAWRYTQKLAGMIWSVLGVALLAVALLIGSRFGKMDAMDMVYKAVSCIIWEIVLTAIGCLAINILTALRYDSKGNLRKPTENAE